MYYSTTVKLVTDDSPAQPLPGVKVALYDRDLFSPDDMLGSEITDARGEACIRYTSDDFVDLDDRVRGILPDLYVVVYGPNGEKVMSTRSEMIENTPQKSMTVQIGRDEALRHRLLPQTG